MRSCPAGSWVPPHPSPQLQKFIASKEEETGKLLAQYFRNVSFSSCLFSHNSLQTTYESAAYPRAKYMETTRNTHKFNPIDVLPSFPIFRASHSLLASSWTQETRIMEHRQWITKTWTKNNVKLRYCCFIPLPSKMTKRKGWKIKTKSRHCFFTH